MAMVPYKRGQMTKKNNKNRNVPFSLNPNQLMYDLGLGAMEGAGKLAVKAVSGIASAFQSRGASRQEIKQLVAPLARSLSYTSRKPTFTKAEGGIAIEHIESVSIPYTGAVSYVIDTNSFTWLKGIASQFEEYQIKLWFAWNPICPATTSGRVMMAFDYDPQDSDTGSYSTPADYFNTADHCVGAIWAPGAISPQKSSWLKTGNTGDSRLYSPGMLRFYSSDDTLGFLTVRYQVSLRKPQPSPTNSEATFGGKYNTTTGIFGAHTAPSGNAVLISSVTDSTLTIAPTAGYKIVVWSTDGTVASVTPMLTGGHFAGVKTGVGAAFTAIIPPGTSVAITATVSLPGFATAYKVTVFQTDVNPLYY